MKKQMRHKKLVVLGALMAALLWMNAQPVSAQVEKCPGPQPTTCVPLNGGGSSAATPFMSQVPLNLLDQSPLPIHYVNGNITGPPAISSAKLHVWTGTRSGTPTILRYSATGSSDGVLKVQQVMSDSRSNMNYLDHTSSTGCSAANLLTRASDSKQYYEYTGCTTVTVLPMTMGMSDVAGSSFHQTGPLTVTVKPLDQSMLTSTQTAIVPWQFIVGEHVKKNIGTPVTPNLVPVVSLSRTEIEAIFSRNVTDWSQVGLVTDVGSTGTPDATSPITTCLRTAGSGSKAGFDETVMKDATETPFGSTDLTQSADGVYFGTSTQDVQDCMRGNVGLGRAAHPRGIAYVDADVSVATAPAYPVMLNGLFANDSSVPMTDPKKNVKCGMYLYWAGERMNVRNYADPGITAAITSLANAFITSSSSSSTVALLPAGAYWVAGSDMYTFKNADGGPVSWTAGAHPCAQ